MDHEQSVHTEALRAENGRIGEDYREEGERGTPIHPLVQSRGGNGSFVGKHRLQAAVSHLNNEINILQKELEQLETMGESSSVCKDLISSVESIPDPLLPITKGSVGAGWDRWFGGAHNSRTHKRWI
ncbi:guanine nucleotide-binding protein subunit gamma 2-like [Senna tora]|uniref:Guanine nucleotide-binding protein subunit gamma 2-like n=1 Tax=Senna tora TaxID=362788 RepID=A0A834TZ94_9FABA|nr:guanine nucleotide-binding protein subunit gamma 2-like [Senna tora]